MRWSIIKANKKQSNIGASTPNKAMKNEARPTLFTFLISVSIPAENMMRMTATFEKKERPLVTV